MEGRITIGSIILGTILKIATHDELTGHLVDGALQLEGAVFDDVFSKRDFERTAEGISDTISRSCAQIFSHHNIPDERADTLCEFIANVIQKSNLSYDTIIANNTNADCLCRIFLKFTPEFEKQCDSKEYEVFERVLRHVADVIVNVVQDSPEYVNHGIKYILSSIGSINTKLETVLKRLEEIDETVSKKTIDFQKFERIYRNNISEKYGWIHLLGSQILTRRIRKYKLSVAYVSLEIRRDDDTYSSTQLYELFSKSRLLWIDGEAGSGKSTLLQWLAINIASKQGQNTLHLSESIPFLIELRKQDPKCLSIQKAIDLIMTDSDCKMPDNWLTHYLESGKAIILIDGLDEVATQYRIKVLDWIEELADRYEKIKIVVTSRPEINDNDFGDMFTKYRLLPMNTDKINLFFEYWHNAVLIDRLGETRATSQQYLKKLTIQIANSESLRRMVSNPLLCAMVCALNYRNGSIMSQERNDLYEDCCKMLLGNRDSEKEVQSFSSITLSYEEKKSILAQIAYWMMKNNLVEAEIERVIDRIEYAIQGLRQISQNVSAKDLFSYFLERSGIIRSPQEGYINFIHKSFQEYLAAFEIHNQDDWEFVASKAHDINWFETLIISMGFASIKNSKLVIDIILKGGDNETNIVIAAACGSNASRLDPELRLKLNSKIERILPPKSIDDSERLSKAEQFVVPYLVYNATYSKEECYYCLNTLRMIPTVQSLKTMGSYLINGIDNRSLDLIGGFLQSFTDEEISSAEIRTCICNYLCEKSGSNQLYIPEIFLYVLDSSSIDSVEQSIRKYEKLTLSGFEDCLSTSLITRFSELQELEIIGEFGAISCMREIAKKIQALTICDYSGRFDFYDLNNLCFSRLSRLHFHSNKFVYITGADCESLCNIQDLGLFLYNPDSELYFDRFDHFKQLKNITIYHKAIEELNLYTLADNTDLDSVTLLYPKDELIDALFSNAPDIFEKKVKVKTTTFIDNYNFEHLGGYSKPAI